MSDQLTVSQLIEQLLEFEQRHGDVPVFMYSGIRANRHVHCCERSGSSATDSMLSAGADAAGATLA